MGDHRNSRILINPEIGAQAFLESFGGPKEVSLILTAMGEKASPTLIQAWYRRGIPKNIFEALSIIHRNKERITAINYKTEIEVHYKGAPLGKFHLAPDVTVIVKTHE